MNAPHRTASRPSLASLLVAALGAAVLGLAGCSGASSGPTCSSGQKTCSGVCTSTQSDPGNCGTCGHACVAGEVCSLGVCALSCGGGTTECGQACVDTNVDPANCGGCGQPCGANEACSGGQCYSRCALPVGSAETECNGIDDNCNGVVDEGCPSGVDAPNADITDTSSLEGSSTGGAAWGPDTCPPFTAVVGIHGYNGGNIDQFGITCAPLSITADTSATPYTYALTTGQTADLPTHGSNATTPYAILCPAGQVVTRIDGYYDAVANGAVPEGVHQLSVYCSDATITGDPSGSTLVFGTPTLAGTATSGYDLTNSTAFSYACPGTAGYMGSVSGRAGAWLDALQMNCYDLNLTVIQ